MPRLGRLDHSGCCCATTNFLSLSFADIWQIGNFIGGALDLVLVHYGFGRSMFYLNQHQLLEFGKYVYGEWIQTFATLMFTKVSICLFLLRIPVTKVLIRPLQAAVAFLVVSNVILTLLWIFQCTPVDAAWNTEIKGRCFSRGELQRIIMAQASGLSIHSSATALDH